MAARTRWNFLAAVSISALMLAANACSEDTTKPTDTGDGDGGDGDGDGDGDKTPVTPILGDKIAGAKCSGNTDCGTDAKATCADKLTGGSLPGLIGQLAGIDLDFSMEAPGGYCTAACKTSAECGEGAACFGIIEGDLGPLGALLGNLVGECRQTCAADKDCRGEYECAAVDASALEGLGGGTSGGSGGGGFGIGTLLPVISGLVPQTCQPKPKVTPIPDDIVGKGCSADSECGAGYCLGATAATETAEAVKGSCSAVCAADTDCGATEGSCLGAIYGSGGTCSETCTVDADCKRAEDGFTCRDLFGTKACLPPTETGGGNTDAGVDPDASVDPDAGV